MGSSDKSSERSDNCRTVLAVFLTTRFQPRSVVLQVWSPTQVHSVEFSKSRIGIKSAFSTNAQSRFASVVVDSVLVGRAKIFGDFGSQ